MKNASGLSLLFAAWENDLDAARSALATGAPVAYRNADFGYRCPLHFAVDNESPDMVELLLNSGAQVSAKDDCGQTPLDVLQYRIEADTRLAGLLKAAAIREQLDRTMAAPPSVETGRVRL